MNYLTFEQGLKSKQKRRRKKEREREEVELREKEKHQLERAELVAVEEALEAVTLDYKREYL